MSPGKKRARQMQRSCKSASLTPLETFIILAAIIGICVSAFVGMSKGNSIESLTLGSSTALVRPGDTLWSMAAKYRTDNLSTAQTVEIIKHMNGIHDPLLSAGESIKVPIPDRPETLTASR